MAVEPVVEPTPDEPVDPSTTDPEPSGDDPVDPVDPGEPGTPSPSDPEPEPKSTEPKKGAAPSGAEKRIKELVAKQREAEREAAYWKGVAEGKVKPDAKPEPQANARPKIEDFTNYDEYVEALVDWKDAQRSEARKTETAQSKQQEAQQKRLEVFNERIADASEEMPEILEYIEDQSISISQAMSDAIIDSEVAPQLVKYFGENRKEAARIARLSPIAAIKELGRIEDKFLNPNKAPTKKISQAPEPISTVKPKGKVVNALDDDAPLDEFMKKRNHDQYGRGRAA